MIENMFRKKALLAQGDPRAKEIIIYVFIAPGAMRGVLGAGQGITLEDLGLLEVLSRIFGVSTGAWIGAYLAAGEIRKGAEVYCTDLPRLGFVRRWPLRKFPLSREALFEATQVRDNRLSIDAVITSPIELYAAVTDRIGNGTFIDVKTAEPNSWAALDASSANPLAHRGPVFVNGQYYWDGGVGARQPIWDICQNSRPQPTDLLVLPNVPDSPERTLLMRAAERAFCETMMRHMPPTLRQSIYGRKESFVQDLANIKRIEEMFGINVHVLWPPECGIHEFTMDEKRLRRALVASEQQTREVFSQCG